MSDTSKINEDFDTIFGEYDRSFAGKPRATRDSNLLSNIIERLQSTLGEARGAANGDLTLADTIKTADDNLDRYLEELDEIRKIQGDSRVVFAAELATQANRVFDRYQRHFAGQDRGTRDHLLLNNMADELVAIEDKMAQLVKAGVLQAKEDQDVVNAQLKLYRDEIVNIKQAHASGTNDEKASRFAELANNQFTKYSASFAGKNRATRRIGLLDRMKSNLKIYRRYMTDLQKSGFHNEMNNNNIGIVTSNVNMYERELKEIQTAKSTNSIEDVAGSLGGAANETFDTYRKSFSGKSRTEVDIELLSNLCDELYEIMIQMREISDDVDIESNDANLRIVEENLASYEIEYLAVKAAQEGTK